MKLGVFTTLLQNLPLEEALKYFKSLGIEMIELGCGGYPGNSHCDPETLLNDEAKFNEFVASHDYVFRKSKERRWVEYNPNPLKKNVGDCTLRAYCKFTGKTWEEMYDISSKFAKTECGIMDESPVVNKFIQEELNCKLVWPKKENKITVNEFAKTHNKGKYIVGVRGHVVAVINGYYYDSWDSGDKKINRIFEPED